MRVIHYQNTCYILVIEACFNIAVSSFEKYFLTANFIFVARDVFDTEAFIKEECNLLGILNFQIIIINSPTKGASRDCLK